MNTATRKLYRSQSERMITCAVNTDRGNRA